MPKDQTLAQDVADIRKIVQSLEEKIDYILQIMESLTESEDVEYEEDDDFDSNEGWIGDVEWFADESDEDEEN